ncbi:MAG: ABC transporter transmembrane domain-containing protein, partial [Carnobacterium sp.]
MKLLYTLPDEAYQIISKIISSESILYCVPYDLDLENNFVEGWLVITKEMCFQIEDSTLKDQFQIDDCHKFEIELLIGNILLIGYDNATSYPILRATATHIQRYRYIVNILNTLSTGEIPQIESEDSERICSKCQSVLVEGTQSCPKCMKKEITYNRIRTLVQPHTLGLMVLALGTLAISLIEIFKTYLFRNLIDVYLVPMNPNFEGILLIFSLLFLAEGIKVLVETLKNRKVLTMGKEIVEMLRDTLFEKIMKIPLNKIETCGVGDLINRINNNTLT